MEDVFKLLPPEEREQLREAMSYAEGTAGALMDFDMVQIREDVTLEVVLRYLRRLDELPDHTDQLFVVDRQEHLKGLMGDAPFCDVCGHVTVRNGACYKCLNCGTSLGCS